MGVIILILVIHLSQLRGTLPQSLRDGPLKEGASFASASLSEGGVTEGDGGSPYSLAE